MPSGTMVDVLQLRAWADLLHFAAGTIWLRTCSPGAQTRAVLSSKHTKIVPRFCIFVGHVCPSESTLECKAWSVPQKRQRLQQVLTLPEQPGRLSPSRGSVLAAPNVC